MSEKKELKKVQNKRVWDSPVVDNVVLIGTGSSSSTPKMDCVLTHSTTCAACIDAVRDPTGPNHRLNPSLLIQVSALGADGKPRQGNIIIDCCKTFRESAIKVLAPLKVSSLDCVILTHDHADATLGLDDLREFSSNHDKKADHVPLEVWTDKRTNESMKRVFPYLHTTNHASWVATIDWQLFGHEFQPFPCCGLPIVPLPVEHGKNYICNGFAIPTPAGTIVYLSDVSAIPSHVMDFIKGPLQPLNCLVLDLLGARHTPVHFNTDEAIAAAKEIDAPFTHFIGMSHSVEYHSLNKDIAKKLPNAKLGRDGLNVYRRLPLSSEKDEENGTLVSE